jgi:hypothetical protein
MSITAEVLNTCSFPASVCVPRDGKIRMYDVIKAEVVTTLPTDYAYGFFSVSLSETMEFEIKVVSRPEEIPAGTTLAYTICYPRRQSQETIDLLKSFVTDTYGDYMLPFTDETAPRFPRALLDRIRGRSDPTNVYSMKTLPNEVLDPFDLYSIFPDEGTFAVRAGGFADAEAVFAVPFSEQSQEVATILLDRFLESRDSDYEIRTPSIDRRVVAGNMGSKSGARVGDAISNKPTVDYGDYVRRVEEHGDSIIHSDANVANAFKLFRELMDPSARTKSNEKRSVDAYKSGNPKNKNGLKAGASANPSVSFREFPRRLVDVDSFAFDSTPDATAAFYASMTPLDTKDKVGFKTGGDKTGLMMAIMREYFRKLILLYGTDGEISTVVYNNLLQGLTSPQNAAASTPKVSTLNKLQSSARVGTAATTRPTTSFMSRVQKSRTDDVIVNSGGSIYDIPASEYESLHPFVFAGEPREMKILDAHDGDTLTVFAKFPMRDFGEAVVPAGRGKNKHDTRVCNLMGECSESLTMYLKFEIRCFNYDAAETYTYEGLVHAKALQMLVDEINAKRVPCTVTFMGKSTYNRQVGDVIINGVPLRDVVRTMTLDDHDLVLSDYDGHEKSEFSKPFLKAQGDHKLTSAEQSAYLNSEECLDRARPLFEEFMRAFSVDSFTAETPKTDTPTPKTDTPKSGTAFIDRFRKAGTTSSTATTATTATIKPATSATMNLLNRVRGTPTPAASTATPAAGLRTAGASPFGNRIGLGGNKAPPTATGVSVPSGIAIMAKPVNSAVSLADRLKQKAPAVTSAPQTASKGDSMDKKRRAPAKKTNSRTTTVADDDNSDDEAVVEDEPDFDIAGEQDDFNPEESSSELEDNSDDEDTDRENLRDDQETESEDENNEEEEDDF